MKTNDDYTDRWIEETVAGRRCLEICQVAVAAPQWHPDKEDVLVERIYSLLPSGDYGRGDVRRCLRAVAIGHD